MDNRKRAGKQSRVPIGCPIRFRSIRTIATGIIHFELTGAEKQHNHSLDQSDLTKKPIAILQAAASHVRQGYRPTDVIYNLLGAEDPAKRALLLEAGGKYVTNKDTRNASEQWRREHPDTRKIGSNKGPLDQRQTAIDVLQDQGYMYAAIQAKRHSNSVFSFGLVFASKESMHILTRRGYLTLMDSTHKTNRLR